MTEEKRHIDQRSSEGVWLKWRRFQPLALELAFIFTGIVLTLTSYIILDVTINNMVREEYDRITQNTIKALARGLSDMEYSVRSASTVLSLSGEDNRLAAPARLKETLPQLENFDHVFWIFKDETGAWRNLDIILKDEAYGQGYTFSIKPDTKLLSLLQSRKVLENKDVSIFTDLAFIAHNANQKPANMSAGPFALVKPVNLSNSNMGFVVAVGTAGAIMDDGRASDNSQVSRIAIRDVNSGYELYNLDRKVTQNQEVEDGGQVYEFNFGERQWEVRTEFMKEQKIEFLESVPFFIILFGLIITSVGTLYVHNNQKKSAQLKAMYTALEQKNADMEAEIKKRARLNQALGKAEQDNRAIIDAVSDIIFETDTEGKILFLSARWRKVTGFDPEQSKGLELFKMLHPQDQEQQRRDFDLMIRGQKQAYRAFTRLRTSDGTFRAVELAVSMIRQDKNSMLRVVGTVTDVEERRRAERALGEAEKKYRAIVENAAGGIYQLTPEGLYLSANPAMARILGFTNPEDILRSIKNANESIYVDQRDRLNLMRELEMRGAINNHESQIITTKGQKIWVNENIRVVRDEGGNTLYYEGSMEDITSRKDSDKALRSAKVHSDLANRAKSEFLANMSHELRTPLNAIIGFSEMIKNEVFGPVTTRAYWEYAKDIHESGHKLLTVINEILDISKIEAGDRHLNESVVDVNKVVKRCLDLLANKIEANQMVVTNTMKDVPNIVAEELAIKQVIMNLLSNAVKFTPSGGRITLSSDLDKDGSLRISVTDTGIGLDEAQIKKALSPFGQVDSELSRGGSGTGLGLTLVDALIRLHGGELELFSQKGIGTTATIVIPVDRVTVQRRTNSLKDKVEKPSENV